MQDSSWGWGAKLTEISTTKTLSRAVLSTGSFLSTNPTEVFKVVLKSGSKDGEQDVVVLQVAVSFVPFAAAVRSTELSQCPLTNTAPALHNSRK